MYPKKNSPESEELIRQRLQWLIESASSDPSIIGFLVVTNAGGVFLANLPADLDTELLSLRFLAVLKNSQDTVEALERGQMKWISFQTENAYITASKWTDYWIFFVGKPEARDKLLSAFAKMKAISPGADENILFEMLTTEATSDLQEILGEINEIQGVIGSLIIGHDGLLIANAMPEEFQAGQSSDSMIEGAESIGVSSLGVYMNTEHVMKKMGHERVHQIVSRTPSGFVVMADFGGGILVTLTDIPETERLIPLMKKITELVS